MVKMVVVTSKKCCSIVTFGRLAKCSSIITHDVCAPLKRQNIVFF